MKLGSSNEATQLAFGASSVASTALVQKLNLPGLINQSPRSICFQPRTGTPSSNSNNNASYYLSPAGHGTLTVARWVLISN